jgi:hypothetical protein
VDRDNRIDPPFPKPDVPELGRHVWDWFFELHRAREYTDGHPKSISFAELKAWAELSGHAPTPENIKLLRLMDGQFLATYAEEMQLNRQRKKERDAYFGA